MSKFVVIDQDGFPIAFYDRDFHGDNIPEGAIPISDDQWSDYLDNQGFRKWVDNGFVEYAPPYRGRERPRIPKSTIISRITDEQLAAALSMMTTRQMERWRAPDQPSVYADDPETIAILIAIGADPAVIMAP